MNRLPIYLAFAFLASCGGGGGSDGMPAPELSIEDGSGPVEPMGIPVAEEETMPESDPTSMPEPEGNPGSGLEPSLADLPVIGTDDGFIPQPETEPDAEFDPTAIPETDSAQESEENPGSAPVLGLEDLPVVSSGDGFNPQPETEPDPQPEPTQEAGTVVGQSLIGDAEVEKFQPVGGISAEIFEYSFISIGLPQIGILLNNNSDQAIFNASCTTAAIINGQVVDTARTVFAQLDPIESGESAIDRGSWNNVRYTFSDYDKISVSCNWNDGDNGVIDVSGPVMVQFVQYTSSVEIAGAAAVTLLLTNNSADTISFALCGVEAKRGNVILDVATLFFAGFGIGEIRPGESVETSGDWRKLSSLDDFDSEPFHLDNVNCMYLAG